MDGESVRETPVGELAHLDGDEQVGVSLIRRDDGSVAVKLAQRSFAPGLGWFDQRTLLVESDQIAPLVNLLNQANRIADALPKPARAKIVRLRPRSAGQRSATQPSTDYEGAKLLPFRTRAS